MAEFAVGEDELAVPAPCCCSNECASISWDVRLDAATGVGLADVVRDDSEAEDTTVVPFLEPDFSEHAVCKSGEDESTAGLSGLPSDA